MELGPVHGLHIWAYTRRLLAGMLAAPSEVGALLRSLLHSPLGRCGVGGSMKGSMYPLPCEPQMVAAMRVVVGFP